METEEIIKAAKEYAGNGFAPGGKPWAHRFAAYRDGAIMANNAAEDRVLELEGALQEAVNQLEYLNGKFPETVTPNSILLRLSQALNK